MGWTRWIAAAIALSTAGAGLVLAGGCFSPTFEACAVSCGEGSACPDDQFCLADGKCHASQEEELCSPDPDGGDGTDADGSAGEDGGDRPDAGDPPDAGIDASVGEDAAPAVTPTESGQLVISEIHKNPLAAQDPRGEWFEVFNPTEILFDLQGLRVRDLGKDRFDIDEPVILPPGERVVFATVADPADNGGVTPDFVYSSTQFVLGNEDDEVIIQNPDVGGFLVVIDGVNYNVDNFPSTQGAALSLDPDRHTGTANNDGASWCDASQPYGDGDLGSPGASNPDCP